MRTNLRYTGLELGESAWVPFDPREVVRRQYGDCKDLSLLLVTLLRGVGVAADVALVDSSGYFDVDKGVAGLSFFDHAIVRVRADGGAPAVWLDPTAPLLAYGEQRGVVQILVNLIGNAVRHSPERKPVRITAEHRAGNTIIHVADSGPGIDPADQQRIFERFEQATSDQGGAGLGLAISRRLARSMGGEIELVSAPGHGARFSLSLPAA